MPASRAPTTTANAFRIRSGTSSPQNAIQVMS
jgi:hypothetical protein